MVGVEKEYELLPWEFPIGQKRNHIDPGWAHLKWSLYEWGH